MEITDEKSSQDIGTSQLMDNIGEEEVKSKSINLNPQVSSHTEDVVIQKNDFRRHTVT